MAKSKKKVKKSTRISFGSGVKKLQGQMGNQLKITPKGVAVINSILNDLCSHLVESIRKGSKTNKMDVNDINKAVKEVFPETMANHAAAEGSKVIAKFRSGLIKYKPPSVKPKRVVKRPKKKSVKRPKKKSVKRRVVKKTKVQKSRKELLLRRLPVKKITVVELPRSTGTVKVKPHTRRMPSRYRRIDLKKPQKIIKKQQKKVRKQVPKVHVKKYTRMVPVKYKKDTKKRVARKKTVRRKKVSKKKKTVGPRFTKGFVALLGRIHPKMKINPKAMKLINSALQSLCTKLVAASQAKAKGSQVTHQDVAAAVQSVLPSTMANHAAAEGTKALTRYAAKI